MLKSQFIPNPYGMTEDRFEDFRGKVIYAIGETEICIAQLKRGGSRNDGRRMRIQTLWRDLAKIYMRTSTGGSELPERFEEFADVFDRSGLADDDFIALCESYLEEIREVAARERLKISDA